MESPVADVAAILVNWRRTELTLEAARRIASQSVTARVIVVDNGSDDGSADRLRRALPQGEIIALPTNGGFGTGCNAGIARALALGCSHVWLLNNDAEPARDALEALLACARQTERIGIVGSRLHDPSGAVPDHAGSAMSSLTLGCTAVHADADLVKTAYSWVSAASALIPLPVLQDIGAFDEDFFMYWEDADLCARIRAAGYTIAVAPDSVVSHSAGTSSADQSRARYLWHLASQARFIDKHLPHPAASKLLLGARYIVKALYDADLRRAAAILRELPRIF